MSERIDTKKVFRYMYRESFRESKLWLCLILLPLSALCIGTGIPFVISHILANLAQNTESFRWQVPIMQLVLLSTFAVIVNRIGFVILLTVQARTLERIENDQVENLLAKDGSFYADRMAGKIVSDSNGLTDAFIQFQDLLAINILPFILGLFVGIVIVSLNSLLLGAGLLVMSVSVVASALYSSKKRAPLRVLRHEALRDLRGHLADIITNSQTVKIFAREDEEKRTHSKLNAILTKRRIHEWKKVSYNGSNRIILILIMQTLFIVLVIFRVTKDPSLLSTGIFAFAFTITLSNRLFEISTMIRGFETSITDAAPMIDILEENAKIVDLPNASDLVVKSGAVEFKNVTFSYEEKSKQKTLFNNLNISVSPGEKIGLVGHSGGGKTTITKLLLRLVDIQQGQILIDTQDIAKMTQQSLRDNIAFVPQEPLLFHRTVRENISYGRPSATIDQIVETAKSAHADEFIKDLPNGYDTLVGERGVKLSGGQRQRVAIARAMLKNAPILLLDEATSALDSESEVLIQKALWKLMEGRTAVVIAHRLSTIQKMDRIIVLSNGKVTESGSHSELISKNGTYAELWAHQSGGFLED